MAREPNGEDIADTETERSEDSNEDEYEDSFIDDDEPDVYAPSPISDGGEMLDNKKRKSRKQSRRRLRKTYQMSESDDEESCQQQNIVNGSSGVPLFQSEDEDRMPISSVYKSKTTPEKTTEEVEGKADMETSETGDKKAEDDGNYVIEPTRKADNVVAGHPAIILEKTEEVRGKTNAGTGATSDKETEDDGDYAIQLHRKACDVFVDGEPKTTTNKTIDNLEGRADKGTCETSYKMTEGNVNHATDPKRKADCLVNGQPKRQSNIPIDPVPPSSEVGPENGGKPKKKRKERSKEEKPFKADNVKSRFILDEKNDLKDEARTNNVGHNLSVKDRQGWKAADYKGSDVPDTDTVLLPCTEVGPEDGERPKKKRKEQHREGKASEADSKGGSIVAENKVQQDDLKAAKLVLDFSMSAKTANEKEAELPENLLLPSAEVGETPKKRSTQQARDIKISKAGSEHNNVVREDRAQQNQNPDNDWSFDGNAHQFADETNSEDKNIKKTKRKSKTEKNGETVNMKMPLVPLDKKTDDRSSQVQVLSNGVTIEVLEMGKPDGKVAASGKKISINYNGRLKKNGELFDSNVGSAPYKFRLGVGKVISGWDIGLDGMLVGEKRRLIIPPSEGFGTQGYGENVPPNSWLVYDIELVKVR
ncbi:Peptidyl-prolyl cis-trans isomerase FKBP53 [Morella rubra]|uniref:peptidylprolyl isomerase n=1 Tax=Morella rubra TaxID=262757 RepID=A0A6A1W127_9ROSI|nr:Peptidyl-prolyl cis-trans isomerase FKBP53 [Morella rubra]KAB1218957.1 Peptidyl-prolyl cis-trans isomerase FKBP53 [Morella rubra]